MRFCFCVVALIFLAGCGNFSKDVVWYRGNTHTHTTLCGHADTVPDIVAKWYLDNDYNFVILSEHNLFIDPKTVNLPVDRRKDFILVPGQEVTGRRGIHTTAMNVQKIIPWHFNNKEKWKIIQSHVDHTHAANGQTILNHPNFGKSLRAADLLKVKKLYFFELYNGHPHVLNNGDKETASTGEIWDELLSAGLPIYGVSSDDAHTFKKLSNKLSNPGRGWVMVNSQGSLTPDALTNAMVAGQFYSSNGIFLKRCEKDHHSYSIEVDHERTMKEISKGHVSGKFVNKNAEDGYLIEFISDGGKVLHSVKGKSAEFNVPKGISYLRTRITLTRMEGNKKEQFFAWGQPIFLDGRSVNTHSSHSK